MHRIPTTPIRARLLLACAIVAWALAGPAPAQAAEKAIWGPLTLPGGTSAFDTYRRLGADTFQLQLRWSNVAATRPANPRDPADPAYKWPDEVDRALAEAKRTGMEVALLVTRTPPWANGNRSAIRAPNSPADFGDFLEAASKRYPVVRKWMIWGEPNRLDRFQPGKEGSPAVSARAYAPLLDAAYVALKRVSRRNIVIGGMTWTGGEIKPQPFLAAMRMPDGRRPRLDWYGHNPFPFRFPNLRELAIGGGFRDISDLDTFSRELRRTYRRPVKLWLSEFTVLSDKRSNVFELFVSRTEQAKWLRAAFGIADSLSSVAGLGWLYLLDQPEAPSSSNWGLYTSTGAPKPAARAYRLAPSVRHRPQVRSARRVGRTRLRKRGVPVSVRPKISGRVRVKLVDRRGRRIASVARRGRAGRLIRLRVRSRRIVRRGRYRLEVKARRGATVRRVLRVR